MSSRLRRARSDVPPTLDPPEFAVALLRPLVLALYSADKHVDAGAAFIFSSLLGPLKPIRTRRVLRLFLGAQSIAPAAP
jgi:hypothetical protein